MTYDAAALAGQPARLVAEAPRRSGQDVEHELSVRVLDTLLRENYANLRHRVRGGAAGPWLDLGCGPDPRVPLEACGFLADLRVARDAGPLSLDDVLRMLAAICAPGDRDGVAAFARECREALAALRQAHRHQAEVVTAGTLVGKERLGVPDINKFYGTSGPNYLRSSR